MMTDEQLERLKTLNVTPGDWYFSLPTDEKSVSICVAGDVNIPVSLENVELMASAKLLLAEVIRQRELLSELRRRTGEALNELQSSDDVTVCGAEITLACVSSEKYFPIGKDRWGSSEVSSQSAARAAEGNK